MQGSVEAGDKAFLQPCPLVEELALGPVVEVGSPFSRLTGSKKSLALATKVGGDHVVARLLASRSLALLVTRVAVHETGLNNGP